VTALGVKAVSAVFGHPSEVAVAGSASASPVLPARRPEICPSRSPVRTGKEVDRPHHSWRRERERRAIGGSHRWERRASASISFAFRGGAITLFTVAGRGMGKARVSIDGDTVATIDGYASTFLPEIRHRFTRLGSGAHTLTVTALGRNPRGREGSAGRRRRAPMGGRLHRDPKPESVS
jgi:hypothetical protein